MPCGATRHDERDDVAPSSATLTARLRRDQRLGGAVFDVCVRYLHENPWRRTQMLCERLDTPVDALTRAQSLYTFELFPDDVVELNSHVLARLGVKVLTVYDALNDNRNLESSVRSGKAAA
jgi:pyruvate/oxaloacetate carboxyltransferase